MTVATAASDGSWSSVLTTTVDTLFQVQAGTILLAIGTPADLNDGLTLSIDNIQVRDSVIVPAGLDVQWRNPVAANRAKLWYADFGV
jgi:hypothetical protein